jgi:cytochrome P450
VELREVDLCDPATFVESVPHELFARMRAETPVLWVDEPGGSGFWSFTRYADVVTINRDNHTFSSHRGTALIHDMPEEQLEQQRLMMLNMDPPTHTRYRLLVNKGFTPRRIAALEGRARQLTNEILDAICEQGGCDFVTDVAAELPLQVIAELMGVPQEDRRLMFDWSNRMVGSADEEYGTDPEDATSASMELYAYANALAAEKRANPQDDILSALIAAEVDGERLTEFEIDMFFLLLAVAGNETTRNLISHGMLALMEHPDERAKLLADPALIPTGIEEMLRWGSPVMHFRRTATKDVVVGGQPVAEGEKVVIWYISANRDEAVFDDPYRFDVLRSPNEHIAFGGGGPHFCLGANLARLEIRVMFEEVLRRMPDMQIAGPVQRLKSNFINGIKHLPVQFTPSARTT